MSRFLNKSDKKETPPRSDIFSHLADARESYGSLTNSEIAMEVTDMTKIVS